MLKVQAKKRKGKNKNAEVDNMKDQEVNILHYVKDLDIAIRAQQRRQCMCVCKSLRRKWGHVHIAYTDTRVIVGQTAKGGRRIEVDLQQQVTE